jgi:HEPN domain-containing protein
VRWNQGRETLEQMLAERHLQRVTPSREHADRLLTQARHHLDSSKGLARSDPEGAYVMAYDAARKALTAILENEGLRPTTTGGHRAVYEAVRAQLDPPMGTVLRPFDRMRRTRHEAEYPPTDAPSLTGDDVDEDRQKAEAIVDLATRLLDETGVF